MLLEVIRFSSQKDSTLGLLFDTTNGREFLCFTLEDEYREKKVMHETRIPAGKYRLGLRTEGGFHNRYKTRFPDIHKGMIQVLNVPNFDYILWHIGNDDDDTSGCLLLGNSVTQNITKGGFIGESTDAYRRIYSIVSKAILSGEEVFVTYIDFDSIT